VLTRRLTITLLGVTLLASALATGCAEPVAPDATPTSAIPTTTRVTPEQVVADPRSRLVGARVSRTPHGYAVKAWWRLIDGHHSRDAIARSDDGFAEATYQRWSDRAFYGDRPPRRDPEPPAEPGRLAWPLTSLVVGVSEGTLGSALGGDGATLFPFEAMARSTDHGESWTTYDVPQVEGERGYLSGGVVLDDGRVLALLDRWSGDRARRPSAVHHGFWVSDRDDWSDFAPLHPVFTPAVDAPDGQHPPFSSLEAGTTGGLTVVWTVVEGSRLFVSVDEGATFTEIPAR
jgi:hypothetical protein